MLIFQKSGYNIPNIVITFFIGGFMMYPIAAQYIQDNARYLEKLLHQHYFVSPCGDKVIKALGLYQNKDGGYGNGLEPDFRLSNSSAMASSVALKLLSEFKHEPLAEVQTKNVISYLEHTFNPVIEGWESVGKLVNLFPHAPWWHYHDSPSKYNLNPSAEILGYLIEFRSHVTTLDVDRLLKRYMAYYLSLENIEEHEYYSVLRLAERMSDIEHALILPKLQLDYRRLVNLNRDEWQNYVPTPLKFAMLDQKNRLGISDLDLQENIKYLKEVLDKSGFISPSWKWDKYEEEWEVAKREWTGILTLEALKALRLFVK